LLRCYDEICSSNYTDVQIGGRTAMWRAKGCPFGERVSC
jgi:hypothetical protein